MMTDHILLVDDNPLDAQLMIAAMKEVHIANPIVHLHDGEEALHYLFGKGKYIDRDTNDLPLLILLDLRMPKVDGVEVLEKIKADEKLRTIPVTVFSQHNHDPEVQKCYRLGVNSFVMKPLDIGEFTKTVAQLGLYWMMLNQAGKKMTFPARSLPANAL